MNSVNKTLYIPLYGKAFVSRRGIILHDSTAEQIWAAEGFPLKGKSKSKWLAYYMGMRAAVFDRWLNAQMRADPSAVILHIGCGMDSRIDRIGNRGQLWYDIDFPEVISARKRFYSETESYRMLGTDVQSEDWLHTIPKRNAIVILEGVSMYFPPEKLQQLLHRICTHFCSVRLLIDCYTTFAAKASKIRNPINDVGVTQVCGLDDPKSLQSDGLVFVSEHEMTPSDLLEQLHGMEKGVFKALYAGSIAKQMYRMYEYRRDINEV